MEKSQQLIPQTWEMYQLWLLLASGLSRFPVSFSAETHIPLRSHYLTSYLAWNNECLLFALFNNNNGNNNDIVIASHCLTYCGSQKRHQGLPTGCCWEHLVADNVFVVNTCVDLNYFTLYLGTDNAPSPSLLLWLCSK